MRIGRCIDREKDGIGAKEQDHRAESLDQFGDFQGRQYLPEEEHTYVKPTHARNAVGYEIGRGIAIGLKATRKLAVQVRGAEKGQHAECRTRIVLIGVVAFEGIDIVLVTTLVRHVLFVLFYGVVKTKVEVMIDEGCRQPSIVATPVRTDVVP